MFGVDFNELLLIFIVGLLVLGPQRLPKVAAEIGKWVGRARRTANELRRQLEREIELNDIQPPPPPSPPTAPTETQNPFHHAPLDGGALPPPSDAPPVPTTPPATESAAAPAASETGVVGAPAEAQPPSAAPAPDAVKAPPTDLPPPRP